MSETKRNMSLCSYVKIKIRLCLYVLMSKKKEYVFVFLCQNQNKIMSVCSKTKTTKKRHYIT